MKVWLWASLVLCGASAQAADIYKCINPVTRDVTYANSPCPKGEEQSKPELIENQIKFTHVEPKPKIERLPANVPTDNAVSPSRAPDAQSDRDACMDALRDYRQLVQNKPEMNNFDLAMSTQGVMVRVKCGEAALPVPKLEPRGKGEADNKAQPGEMSTYNGH